MDRLNESRDVVRTLARNTIVDLGLAAVQIGGTATSSGLTRKGEKVETVYGTFERSMREQGLAHKGWRAREQVTISLPSNEVLGSLLCSRSL